jgi:hypothetical protein
VGRRCGWRLWHHASHPHAFGGTKKILNFDKSLHSTNMFKYEYGWHFINLFKLRN